MTSAEVLPKSPVVITDGITIPLVQVSLYPDFSLC